MKSTHRQGVQGGESTGDRGCWDNDGDVGSILHREVDGRPTDSNSGEKSVDQAGCGSVDG